MTIKARFDLLFDSFLASSGPVFAILLIVAIFLGLAFVAPDVTKRCIDSCVRAKAHATVEACEWACEFRK